MDSSTRDYGRKQTAVARVVRTLGEDQPYKVVFTDENGKTSEHPFATIQDCEAFIRSRTPVPTERSKLYDRKSGEA